MERKFALRGHRAGVSAMAACGADLVSADRDGWVVVWSVATRRPRARWRAHEGHVATVEPTAHGLLTHGRDMAVRFWDAAGIGPGREGHKVKSHESEVESHEFRLESHEFEVESHLSKLESHQPQLGLGLGLGLGPGLRPRLLLELPVNALNFCNVAVRGNLLATPALTGSDGVDIYSIAPLARVAHHKGQAHGIVMRLVWAGDTLYAGYESGAVEGYAHGARVFSSPAHLPNPVLSLARANGRILAGSASNVLLSVLDNTKKRFAAAGLQGIAVGKLIHLCFWDGTVVACSDTLDEVARVRRPLELLGAAPRRAVALALLGDTLFVGFEDGLVHAYVCY